MLGCSYTKINMRHFLLLSALLQFQWQVLFVESQFDSPANASCACPGDVLSYFCTVDGGNVTIWSGSAFDCPGNTINLTHLSFRNGTSRTCNGGAIVGQSVKVDGTRYTSKLNVAVSNGLNNTNITCSSDVKPNIGKSEIKMAVLAAPDSIYLADAQNDKLLFSWNSVTSNESDCSGVKYKIISDCGTCPTFTDMTATACSNLQLTNNAINMCQFRVSTAICDKIESHSSPPVIVKLKVPSIPQVKIIPSYSQQALERLFIITTKIQIADFFYISGNISGFPISYTAHTYNPVSGSSFDSTLTNLTSNSRESGRLSEHSVEVPSFFHCPQLTIINISISAANKLGEGPHSKPFIIECINNFVQIVYKETASESTISCVFQNQSDTSEKSCCITYGLCDQKMPENQSLECNGHKSKIVTDSVCSGQLYCYTAIASNKTYMVKVKGSFIAGFDHLENISTTVVVAIVIPLTVCVTCTTVIVIVICACIIKRKKRQYHGYHRLINEGPLEQYLTEYDLPTSLKLLKVRNNCKLQEYITKTVGVEFKRGHTYYEFTNEIENILEGKEVLLQMKKNKKWFKLAQPEEITAQDKKFYGEGIARSSFGDQYRVFIQSFGSGARHLPRSSNILYDHDSDQVQPDVLPLVPICSEHFTHKAIDSDRQCIEFCIQNRLNTTSFNIFLTVEHLSADMRDQPLRDVILMDRRSKELFTGPKARQMLDSSNGDESQHEKQKWKVFVLLPQKKQGLILTKGSEVLYQDPRYMTGNYEVVEVDEDNNNVRMSKFIEAKLHLQFEDRKAFYAATENEEDFVYYKKILRLEEEKLSHEQLELQSLVEYFYAIDGVPAKGVKFKGLRHMKVFIQSTSQGSRCLRKGEKLLYLKQYISSDDHKFQVDPDEANHHHPGSILSEDEHYHLQGQK